MDIKPIRTDADYEAALRRVEELMGACLLYTSDAADDLQPV